MSLQIQELSNNYNTVLSQYTGAYKNYINALNSNDINLTNTYNNQLQQLNSQLINMNKQIINDYNATYNQNEEEGNRQQQILINNYEKLTQERNLIDDNINAYQTLDNAYETGNNNITSNYYKYIVFVFVVIFLLFILMRINFSGEQRGGGGNLLNLKNNIVFGLALLGVIIIITIFSNK